MSTSTNAHPGPAAVIDFWFRDEHRKLWFRSNPEFDQRIRERFLGTWEAAGARLLDPWKDTSDGALALVIVLDQFPLNMFRGQPESFSTEAAAREVAEHAIASGLHARMAADARPFLYLPFMHSEDLADQDHSVSLFETSGLADNLRWARHHREVIRRFGRFPHRNAILGRPSTVEETAWLASPEAFSG